MTECPIGKIQRPSSLSRRVWQESEYAVPKSFFSWSWPNPCLMVQHSFEYGLFFPAGKVLSARSTSSSLPCHIALALYIYEPPFAKNQRPRSESIEIDVGRGRIQYSRCSIFAPGEILASGPRLLSSSVCVSSQNTIVLHCIFTHSAILAVAERPRGISISTVSRRT